MVSRAARCAQWAKREGSGSLGNVQPSDRRTVRPDRGEAPGHTASEHAVRGVRQSDLPRQLGEAFAKRSVAKMSVESGHPAGQTQSGRRVASLEHRQRNTCEGRQAQASSRSQYPSMPATWSTGGTVRFPARPRQEFRQREHRLRPVRVAPVPRALVAAERPVPRLRLRGHSREAADAKGIPEHPGAPGSPTRVAVGPGPKARLGALAERVRW
jgi:hypothetical protein